MKKAVILADLHLHHLPTWRMDWNEEFITNLLNDYGTASGGYDLYLLGDVFEIRDKVDSRILNTFIKLVTTWKGGSVIWISGQHDSYIPGRATVHELNNIKLDNGTVHVVDEHVLFYNGIHFVPFQRREEIYRERLATVPDGATVLTHIPAKEIIEMYGGKVETGISVEEFKRFNLSISGDIHKWYDFPNLKYVGAPSQRDWRDKNVEGCFATLIDGQFNRISTQHPRHIEIENEYQIPKDGEFVIRVKRGTKIDAANVLSSVETSTIDVTSINLTVGGTQEEQIDKYIKNNKPPCLPEQAIKYARTLLGGGNE